MTNEQPRARAPRDRLTWPPAPDASSRWHALRFRLDGVDGIWALRQVTLWDREVLITEDGRPFCWGLRQVVPLPPPRRVQVDAFLRLHRFSRLPPSNAGVGAEPTLRGDMQVPPQQVLDSPMATGHRYPGVEPLTPAQFDSDPLPEPSSTGSAPPWQQW